MADRWFVVPLKEFEETDSNGNVIETYTAPKYSDTAGVEGFSGNIHFFDKETYAGLPFVGKKMFVVRFYGDEAALDSVTSHGDAYGKQEYGLSDSEVAGYLNDRFDEDRSFEEWLSDFGVSV